MVNTKNAASNGRSIGCGKRAVGTRRTRYITASADLRPAVEAVPSSWYVHVDGAAQEAAQGQQTSAKRKLVPQVDLFIEQRMRLGPDQ